MSYQKRPGKFESSGALGELFHAISLEGFTDDQISFENDGSGADLFRGPFDLDKFAESWPEEVAQLNSVDRDEITSAAGVIVFLDSQGFVDVNLYDTEHDLERSWQSVQAAAGRDDEDMEIAPGSGNYEANARGIYQETGASQDDFVIHADHRGQYVVDLVQRGGTHLTIGPTRGYSSVPEAMDAARYEAQRRGIRAGVIFGVRKDGTLRQLGHAPRSHQVHPDPTELEPNGAPPEKYREMHERVWAEARRQGYEPVETEWAIPMGEGAYQVVVRSPGGKTGMKVVLVQVHQPNGGSRSADPKWSAAEELWRRREIVLPNEADPESELKDSVIEALYSWHGGQFSAVYSLASTGHHNLVSRSMIDRALPELESALKGTKGADRKHLKALIGELNMVRDNANEFSADTYGMDVERYEYDTWSEWGGDMEPNARGGDPSYYLSMSEGKFRVIHGGVPIGPDRPTAAEALAFAEKFKVKVSDRMWNGDTGEWQPLSQSPNARGGSVDQHAADELELYLENDARFSMHGQGQGHSALINQLRKFRKGNYDHELAPKLWGYVVEAAAQQYCKEMGCSLKWHEMFSKPTREVVAQSLADQFLRAAQGGEFDHVDTRIGR